MPGVTNQSWARYPCRDPWINIAYNWAFGVRPVGSGDHGECWTGQYVGGRWSDYNQLVHSISKYRSCMKGRGLRVQGEVSNSRTSGIYLIKDVYGRPVGKDSATLVAQGGGTLVAQGGGTLVAQGGGNLVAQGGGNLTLLGYRVDNLPDASRTCAN